MPFASAGRVRRGKACFPGGLLATLTDPGFFAMSSPRSNPVVLITGACGDIGRSLARVFAGQGSSLALVDLRSADSAEAQLAEWRKLGVSVCFRRVDVREPPAMNAFVAEAVRELGGLDVCIVNAGIVERGALLELTVEAWRRTLDVNLTGAFVTAQAAARAMVAAGRGGHIVFISSWVQDVPREGIGAYSASKGGMKMLAKTLALELAPKGIRVNLVAPGWVDAGLTGQHLQAHPERRPQVERQIPLGRLATADEVARAVRLLCSPDAAYVNGATLLLDGGSSLGLGR